MIHYDVFYIVSKKKEYLCKIELINDLFSIFKRIEEKNKNEIESVLHPSLSIKNINHIHNLIKNFS